MDHRRQVALTRRIFALAAERSTDLAPEPYVNRAETYTSAAQLERERALLFRREPLLVCLSADVIGPGAYVTRADAGVPIVVVRSRAGALNAFLNVCRHRGAQVVAGSGHTAGRFTCPYHGWTYAADDGRVVAQPCPEGFTGLADDARCLLRLPVAERYGMVFVRATPGDPIDVDAHLGGAEQELAPFGLERYVPFAQCQSERTMNWKLVVDGFLEAYHVPSLHERTLAPALLGAPALWDSFGRCGRMLVARRSITALRGRPETEWDLLPHCLLLYLVFPNTIVIHQSDHFEVVQAFPGANAAGAAKILFTLYTPEAVTTESARRHFQANLDLLVDTVSNEDFPIAEQIQRGLATGLQATVVYGRNEAGLVHFHRTVNAAVAGSTERDAATRPPLARRR